MVTIGKKVILDSPGERITNVIVYDVSRVQVSECEITRSLGRATFSPTSKNFPSTASVSLGNVDIIGSIYMTAILSVSSAAPNVCASSGWLFSAIRYISHVFGASNTGPINVAGDSVLLFNLSCAENSAKRDKVLSLGGPVINGAGTYEATLLIPIVMSNMGNSETKLPLDLAALNAPLQLNVMFRSNTDFLSGSDATKITQFDNLTITLETLYLTNRVMSPAMQSRIDPSVAISYPYNYLQSNMFRQTGVIAGQEVPITLCNLINADVMSIIVAILPLDNYEQNQVTYANPLSIANWVTPIRMRLALNGEIYLYSVSSSLIELDELVNADSTNKVLASTMSPSGQTTYPFTFDCQRHTFSTIQWSTKRAGTHRGTVHNTRRAPSSTPVLSLVLPTSGDFVIFYSYCYTALLTCHGGSSETQTS
jgi:hypothetical protein